LIRLLNYVPYSHKMGQFIRSILSFILYGVILILMNWKGIAMHLLLL